MKLASNISVTFKENSGTHFVLKYVKFKGGSVDITEASGLFKGKIQDKNKARISAEILVRDKCLTHVSGDKYKITEKGKEVILLLARKIMVVKPVLRDW
jgi:hypothetical protein